LVALFQLNRTLLTSVTDSNVAVILTGIAGMINPAEFPASGSGLPFNSTAASLNPGLGLVNTVTTLPSAACGLSILTIVPLTVVPAVTGFTLPPVCLTFSILIPLIRILFPGPVHNKAKNAFLKLL
jgi:hypothetical protein